MKLPPEVTTLLRTQFGVISTSQLARAGVAPRTISRLRSSGAFAVVLPGVLRSVEHASTFEARAMAVQLHAGETGALSGPTAARLYGLRQMPTERIWLRVDSRSRITLPRWVRRTESPWLFTCEGTVRRVQCWRLLAPAALLLTLAESFNDHRFERAAEDAWHLGLVTPGEAAAFLSVHRCHGRRGVARFDHWLRRTQGRARPSQSGFELDVLDALRRTGLPEPERQHAVTLPSGETVHLDFAWPEAMLAVEPGHSWWHGGDLRLARDYARDRACGRLGWHVMRYEESARADLAALAAEVLDTYRRRLPTVPAR